MSCGFDSLDSQYSSMSVFSIILAVFLITVNALGVLGNLLVLITISFNRRFHVMRYLLLSSLAASDFLFLVLVLPTRVAAKLQEDLVWSMTWCQANAFVARSLYCSGNLHLIAISYDRYQAVVKKPLTYDELMNKAKFMLLLLLWVVPIAGSVPPLYSLWGEYAYNQELQVCDQRWDVQNEDHLKESVVSSVCVFAFPLMAIAWLNFKVGEFLEDFRCSFVLDLCLRLDYAGKIYIVLIYCIDCNRSSKQLRESNSKFKTRPTVHSKTSNT